MQFCLGRVWSQPYPATLNVFAISSLISKKSYRNLFHAVEDNDLCHTKFTIFSKIWHNSECCRACSSFPVSLCTHSSVFVKISDL